MSLIVNGNNDFFNKTGHKTVFSLRLDESVYDLLKQIAQQEKRSINGQIEIFLEEKIIEYIESGD